MRTNPVYKREMVVSARSFRLAMTLLLFNGIIALVVLLSMYSTLAQVRLTAEMQYTSFLDLYLFVAVLEFIMLIVIMPALTAGSISGERERQTLDLMLTTKMKPSEIVLGKLMASFSTMLLLIISSFPLIAMVFVYGGVTMRDLGLLLLCYVAASLFTGSIGVVCSSLCRKSTTATVASYGFLAMIVLGTYGVNQVVRYLDGLQGASFLKASGNLFYLLLINPASTFLLTLTELLGYDQTVGSVSGWLGTREVLTIHTRWVEYSIALQLLLTLLFIWIAIAAITPKKKGR